MSELSVIPTSTIDGINGMLDRAKLTELQAYGDLLSNKFTEAQYNIIVSQMADVINRCQMLIASITIIGISNMIPTNKLEAANKIAKAFSAISKLN